MKSLGGSSWRGGIALWLVVAAIAGLSARVFDRPRSEQKDLILITVDTLRADRLGIYGYPDARTPVIDDLGRRGTLFLEATTPFPRTTPALASLLTGLWPQHHGSREVAQNMRPVETLATLLARRGYVTVGVTANRTAGRSQGFARGFDAFRQADVAEEGVGRVTTERALGLSPRRRGRPLFLWVHYVDPHFPYDPPVWWQSEVEATACRELARVSKQGATRMGAIQADQGGVASAALEDCLLLYDEEIAYTDHEIGRLLTTLEERGLLEDAFVVLTSDHGENLGEERLFYEHGPSLHDASLRVPLIVAGPGVRSASDGEVARLEDLAPTLLSLLGVDREEWPRIDGEDLSPRLLGSTAREQRRPAVAMAESGSALHHQIRFFLRSGRAGELECVNGLELSLCGAPGGPAGLFDQSEDPDLTTDLSARFPRERELLEQAAAYWGAEQARQRSVRTERFKLVERPSLTGEYERRLYDLDADPEESLDVSAEFPEVQRELARLLDAWTDGLPAFLPPERAAEELEEMRALGYIQ